MSTKSRESIYGTSIRITAEKAKHARKEADQLPCEAWSQRMLAYKGHTNQTMALDIIRRPKTTPVHELERYMRCKDCSERHGRPFKRSSLVALRATKISAENPRSVWWPGER